MHVDMIYTFICMIYHDIMPVDDMILYFMYVVVCVITVLHIILSFKVFN